MLYDSLELLKAHPDLADIIQNVEDQLNSDMTNTNGSSGGI